MPGQTRGVRAGVGSSRGGPARGPAHQQWRHVHDYIRPSRLRRARPEKQRCLSASTLRATHAPVCWGWGMGSVLDDNNDSRNDDEDTYIHDSKGLSGSQPRCLSVIDLLRPNQKRTFYRIRLPVPLGKLRRTGASISRMTETNQIERFCCPMQWEERIFNVCLPATFFFSFFYWWMVGCVFFLQGYGYRIWDVPGLCDLSRWGDEWSESICRSQKMSTTK